MELFKDEAKEEVVELDLIEEQQNFYDKIEDVILREEKVKKEMKQIVTDFSKVLSDKKLKTIVALVKLNLKDKIEEKEEEITAILETGRELGILSDN